jgi:hypothetical protein
MVTQYTYVSAFHCKVLAAGIAVVPVGEAKAQDPINGRGVLEFKDAGAGSVGGDNEVWVRPGDTFSFDAWLRPEGEKIAAVSFKLRFPDYNPTTFPHSFTIADEVAYDTPQWDPINPVSVKGERLETDNASILGAEIAILHEFEDQDSFFATLSLTVDSDMPLGDYIIEPNSTFFKWVLVDNGEQDFRAAIPYTIHVVVPEPGTYALAGALGLLGFAAFRRWGGTRG